MPSRLNPLAPFRRFELFIPLKFNLNAGDYFKVKVNVLFNNDYALRALKIVNDLIGCKPSDKAKVVGKFKKKRIKL